jgi:hypothetical protein
MPPVETASKKVASGGAVTKKPKSKWVHKLGLTVDPARVKRAFVNSGRPITTEAVIAASALLDYYQRVIIEEAVQVRNQALAGLKGVDANNTRLTPRFVNVAIRRSPLHNIFPKTALTGAPPLPSVYFGIRPKKQPVAAAPAEAETEAETQ